MAQHHLLTSIRRTSTSSFSFSHLDQATNHYNLAKPFSSVFTATSSSSSSSSSLYSFSSSTSSKRSFFTEQTFQRQPFPYHSLQHRTFSNTTGGTKPGQTSKKIEPQETIFGKLVRGEVPCQKVYEDDSVLAFHDVNPQAPVHILLIPKLPISGISRARPEHEQLMGHLLFVAAHIARDILNLEHNGYRLVINEGLHGQQSVSWLHLHLLAGRQMTWPPG